MRDNRKEEERYGEKETRAKVARLDKKKKQPVERAREQGGEKEMSCPGLHTSACKYLRIGFTLVPQDERIKVSTVQSHPKTTTDMS